MSGVERRFFPMTELRMDEPDEGQRLILGYGAVFNSLSEDLGGFREIVLPGFFDAVLGDDVRSLFNHDLNQILGRSESGTLQIGQDEMGLRYRVNPPDTGYAQDLINLIRRGDVTQNSFGFTVAEHGSRWYEREDGTVIRELIKAKRLYDVGPVTLPAYSATSVQVRSLMNLPDIPAGVRGATASASDNQESPVDWQGQLDLLKRKLDLIKAGG